MAEKTEFLQAIDDAILDADSLEQFINGDDSETVLTRLSAEYPTLQKALKELFENGNIAGRFKTLTDLQASDLVDGDYALVADDADDKNGTYIKEGGIWAKSKYDPLSSAIDYTDESTAVVFPFYESTMHDSYKRLRRGVKGISFYGNYYDKLLTIASFTYSNGTLTISIAMPDSIDEVMASSGNTKFVSRVAVQTDFEGIKTFELTPYGNVSAGIGGYITIDFAELKQSDYMSANYTARDRLIAHHAIKDANGNFNAMQEVKALSQLVSGTDAKNKMLNNVIEEVVFFKPIPQDKYLILGGLFYTNDKLTMQIYAADDKTSKGTLWAKSEGLVTGEDTITLMFDQGYAVVNISAYVQSNTGAATLGDNATYSTRGINTALIKQGVLSASLFQRFPNQFNSNGTFHLPTDYRQRSVKLYLKGEVADDDYYLLSVFNWSESDGIYKLTIQIRKMTEPDEPLAQGKLVYGIGIEFNSLDDVKGKHVYPLPQLNGHLVAAEIEIDYKYLEFRTDYNNVYTQNIFNKSDLTWANSGFDVVELREAANERFGSGSGIAKYTSLHEAVAFGEKSLFAVGGNLFKSTKEKPLTKDDIICVNNPPKRLARKSKEKSYDFFYLGAKTRLEIIGHDDEFYFVNSTSIIKAPHAMKQAWSPVASASASDFVVLDVANSQHYSIPNFTELFTASSLGVDSIFQARLTYDDELFIITVVGGNRTISFTENEQSSLRTFNFNGSASTKYTFGQGVNIVKDWSMTHYKNIMFVSDYDSGVGGVRGTTGGQKAYVSLDNGYTFTKCFDFSGNDWSNVTNAGDITNHNPVQAHIHAVTYDPKQDVVWIVTGDGGVSADNASFFYSRDKGATWTQFRSRMVDTGGKSQMIMALPFDGCVAFGSDDGSLNGVGVLTYNGDTMVHEVAAQYADKNLLLCFARSTWARDSSPVKYMSFGKDSQKTADPDAESFVVASSNGYTWETVWRDNNSGIYGNVFVYDDKDSNVYVTLDGSGEYKERVVVMSVSYN